MSKTSWSSRALVCALAASFLVSSCASTTRINTSPDGSKVKVNGIYLGESPVTYRYRSGLPETYIVDIEKDGYKPLNNATIDRSLRADASLVLLLLAIVPYFFSARLEDQYTFTLEPLTPAPAPEPAPTPPPAQ
jgi:hypothetical protein